MPGKPPDYDVCTPTSTGYPLKIGAAWAFTDKNDNTGYSINLDALPIATTDEKYGMRTGLLLFKHKPRGDAPKLDDDDPF